MKDEKSEHVREYLKRWKKTGEILKQIEMEEFRRLNLAETILSFESASRSALQMYPPKPTSGLIEFHKLMAKTKRPI
jgi:hypothetical protein